MKTKRGHIHTTAGQKGVPCGGGAGCASSLMIPVGIIAVGLTGDDSTGIGARSGGADGTAPMVLTRMRQCHPGPAGIGWRGKAPRRRCKTKFCYTSFTAEVPGRQYLKRFGCVGRRTGAANGFKMLTGMLLSERKTQRPAAAGADCNAPQRDRGMIDTAVSCAVHGVDTLNTQKEANNWRQLKNAQTMRCTTISGTTAGRIRAHRAIRTSIRPEKGITII